MAEPTESTEPIESTEQTRLPLSRERAVAVAVALADREGLGALSMRRLAQRLGVEAMSLYHHVANKDEILGGMVEAVFAEIELPSGRGTWREEMWQRAWSLRAVLLRHPWAIGVLESRRSPGPATLRHHDAVIGSCRRAGFSIEMAAHAFSLIDSYVYGFVLQEITLPFDEDDHVGEILDELQPESMADVYPHFAELAAEHVRSPGYRYGDEFEYGLGLVLESLERAAEGQT